VAHLDRAIADRIGRLQARDDLTGGKGRNLEFVVGRFGDRLGEDFASAIDRLSPQVENPHRDHVRHAASSRRLIL
jgi:hypothetical protein